MATKKHSKLKTFLTTHFNEFEEKDSERLTALYTDFTKLSLFNKYAYDANISFWKRVILDSNAQGYLNCQDYAIAIEKETLAEKFQRPVIGKPLSFGCVLDTMVTEKSLISLEEFNQKYSAPSTWLGWIYQSILPSWLWRHDPPMKQMTHYIVLPTLETLCKAILSHQLQNTTSDQMLTLTQFKSTYAHHFINQIELKDTDISIILRYLHSHYGVALADNVKGYSTSYMVIKFPQKEGQQAVITQQDQAIMSIRTTCHALSVQVDELQKKAQELHQESIQEKQKGNTAKALYCLKRKKNLIEVLEKRLKSMETMDTILMKIETSKDDIQVVQAFNLGADTLKSLLGQDGLTLESVDEAMEKIQNALENQKEIEDAIYTGNNELSEFTDHEIEDELSELIQEEARVSSPPVKSTSPISPSKPTSPTSEEKVNSELARLNSMFSSSKSSLSNKQERVKELA